MINSSRSLFMINFSRPLFTINSSRPLFMINSSRTHTKGIHHFYFACVIWSLATQSGLTVCSCFQLVLQHQRHLLFLHFWHFGQQFLSDGICWGVCIHRDVQLGSLQEYITQQNSAEISPVLGTDWQAGQLESTMNWPGKGGWGDGGTGRGQ